MTLHGEQPVIYFKFLKKNTYVPPTDSYLNEDRGIKIYKYDWITIEKDTLLRPCFKIIADPNESARKRNMTIKLNFGAPMEIGTVKITQAGK